MPRGYAGEISRNLSDSAWEDLATVEPDEIEFRPGRFFVGAFEGRYVGLADDRHLLTVAGSRAGKGTSLIVPNILFWPASVIAIDPKGELATITARRRGDLGKVYVLDPFEKVEGEGVKYRASYNPLAALDPDSESGHEMAGMIA
ncbi:type IV secretory system conjugative DNA transfer family protein, partial (plasmid) [Acuticoccus sp. MNP-M23]|uniref:type IV secretory system conjugative DNA transfer family protein n=1 Tax=Acuticoccus sp. MNP-M23 TaxID=3072793 RepID=UPI00281565E8